MQITKTNYLCPGCLFHGNNEYCFIKNNILYCLKCTEKSSYSYNDDKSKKFYHTFMKHAKSGYRCLDCKRFIPHPHDYSIKLICPYFDCYSVIDFASAKKMHHPKSLIADADADADACTPIHTPEHNKSLINIDNDLLKIYNAIIYCKNMTIYNSHDFTFKLKYLSYESIENIFNKNPDKLCKYLLYNSRSGGFQHKFFQEFIRIIELSLPILFKKKNSFVRIESILDLNLFDGLSTFVTEINDNMQIKNATDESYMSKPYYIGKLLSINDSESGQSLIDKVTEYSFSKIKMINVKPNTRVIVRHLRIPPHYQTGGMSYINRARQNIINYVKTN